MAHSLKYRDSRLFTDNYNYDFRHRSYIILHYLFHIIIFKLQKRTF